MTHDVPAAASADDRWYDWLLHGRHGGDAEYARRLQPQVEAIRDRLLDAVPLQPGVRIADLGCGDGLVGFAVLDRRPDAAVTFVDLSPALVEHARTAAAARGVGDRCRFVVGSITRLDAIASASVDAVTVRAVLAYVDDKPRALAECRRILRPGGRLSLVDPIFRDRAFALAALASQFPLAGVDPAAAMYADFLHRCGRAHLPDTLAAIGADPLTNYDERDLLTMAEAAGFVDVHLRLHIDRVDAPPMPWATYLRTSPRAGVPTVAQTLQSAFTAAERAAFERLFRPRVEAGTMPERNVNAYLFADAP